MTLSFNRQVQYGVSMLNEYILLQNIMKLDCFYIESLIQFRSLIQLCTALTTSKQENLLKGNCCLLLEGVS